MDNVKGHWERTYSSKDASQMSWYQPHLRLSLDLIQRAGIGPEDRIVDVGGGASTLVDDLLDRGYCNITVIDVSSTALEIAKRRLGSRAALAKWIVDDVLHTPMPQCQLWHDRAVFHFLTNPADRHAYISQLRHALIPGGFAVLSTFSLDGPHKCSGLEVCRYSVDTLLGELGSGFRVLASMPENHRTPSGVTQSFLYCLLTLETQSHAP